MQKKGFVMKPDASLIRRAEVLAAWLISSVNAVVMAVAMVIATIATTAIAAPPAQAPAYPGTVTLRVDASNIGQWIFQVQQRIPAAPGRLVLLYPRWLPGTHGPYGNPRQIAGLVIQAGGQRLAWRRSSDDVHAFEVHVPAGAQAVDVSFQWLGSPKGSANPNPLHQDMFGLQWPTLVLYPATYAAAAIEVQAAVKLPAGWGWGSALRARSERDGWVEFQPVSLETLIDSPLYAGASYRRVELDPPGAAHPAVMHLFSDRLGGKVPSDEQLETHRRLVVQAERLFGSRPWRHYDLLLANLKGLQHTALEHHESSENSFDGRYFDDWAAAARRRDDVAHELVHAWNGKFRRPADLWAPDFNTASSNALLWVYEGLTQYWGVVVAARSGLITPEQARRSFSNAAAWYGALPGRQWRNLQDTTNDPAFGGRPAAPWPAWARGWDYYGESALSIWLDADTLIRERTNGQQSLDDFARRFFSGPPGHKGPDLYTFDDVVAAMNAVFAHDWRGFFRERLDRNVSDAVLEGLTRAGWKLDFNDARSPLDLASLDPDKPTLWLGYSLGIVVDKEGEMNEVMWDAPAFREGLRAGDKIVAVNLRAYTPDRLEAALVANKGGLVPVELLVKRGDDFRSVMFDVRGGPRHPALVRIDAIPDRLADIFKPR